MPIHLEPIDVSAELEGVGSVLIVACPICPPMSLAMQKESPLIEFFKRGIKTRAFEDFIREIREPLERRGVRTGVFTTYLPCPTMCLWTKGQRRRFLARAKNYEPCWSWGAIPRHGRPNRPSRDSMFGSSRPCMPRGSPTQP